MQRGSPQARGLWSKGFCIACVHPIVKTGRPAGPQAHGKFRITHQALKGGLCGALPRPHQGWKWGVGAGPEVPDKGGSRVWIWDADLPSHLNPPHPQSLGTGRAPQTVTQKPDSQQLLPGAAHVELHCLPGSCQGFSPLSFSARPLAPLPLETHPDFPKIPGAQ